MMIDGIGWEFSSMKGATGRPLCQPLLSCRCVSPECQWNLFLEMVSSYRRNARVHIFVVSFIVFGTVITFTEGLGKSEDNSYPGWTFKFIPENLSWHERQK